MLLTTSIGPAQKAVLCSLALLASVSKGDDEQCRMLSQADVTSVGTTTRVPGQIIDITKELTPETVTWESPNGLGNFRERYTRIEEGDLANQSQLKDFPVHLATHVDAAGHFVHASYLTGKGVEALDLYKLNGPVLVKEVPSNANITAGALEELAIPAGVERIIFKTLNTERGLMHQTPFVSDYTAMTEDGAQWILDHTDIQLVGIDYTSIAHYDDLKGPHLAFLPNDVVILEGVVLDSVQPGIYMLHCLPLKIVGSDGAPTRCILIS